MFIHCIISNPSFLKRFRNHNIFSNNSSASSLALMVFACVEATEDCCMADENPYFMALE